jgi:hypothetical protein
MRRLFHWLRRTDANVPRPVEPAPLPDDTPLLFQVIAEKRRLRETEGRHLFQELERRRAEASPTTDVTGGGEAAAIAAAAIESVPASGETRARFRVSVPRMSLRLPLVLWPRLRFGIVPHAPRLRVTKGRLSIATALAVALAIATVGIAYWTTGGTGAASGSVGTLEAPQNVTVPSDSVGTVHVTWDAITAPDGGDADGYYVVRDDGVTPAAACGSSPGSPLVGTATDCDDTAVPNGTYTYKVTAVFRSWTAESDASGSVTVDSALDHFDVLAPASSTAGDSFNVTVTAKNASNHTLTGYTGTVQFSSSDGQADLPSDYPFVGGDNGVHMFIDGVALKTAGNQTVNVRDSVQTTKTGSATVAVSAAGADHFNLTNPGSQTAGIAFDVTLTAKDAYGNTADTYSGVKTLVWSGPGDSPAPSSTSPLYPSSATSVTFAGGVGTATGIKLYKAETPTLHAADGGITGDTSFAVAPGDADHFTVDDPGTQTAGSPFSVSITALDQWSNTATSYAGSKTIAFSGPNDSPAPSSTPPSYPGTVTFVGGAASPSITLFKAESTTLHAADGGIAGTSPSFTVNPAGAHHFNLANPGTRTAGAAFSVSITALDQWSNVATGYAGSKSIVFSGPGNSPAPSNAPPTYPGSVTFAAGLASPSVTLFKAENTSLTATDSSITGSTGTFTVLPAAIDHFSVDAPGTTQAGDPFSATVTAFDQYSNAKTNYAGTVHLAVGSGQATLPGDYTFTTGGGNDNGVHTFSVTLKTTPSQTINVNDTVTTSATGSATVTVTPGPLDHFTVSPDSGTQTAGSAFTVTVTAFDAFNNTKTNYTGTITFSSNDPQAVFPSSGTYTFVSGDNGQHTFSAPGNGVTLKTAGTGKTVTVTDSGKTGQASYTVNALTTVDHLAVTTTDGSPLGTQTAGTAFSVKVTAQDQFNNTVTGYTGNKTLTWGGTPCSPNCPGTAPDGTHTPTYPGNPVSFASGTATVSVTLFKAESPKLGVSDGTKTGVSATFTVNAGAAARLAWTSVSATSGSATGLCFFTCTWPGLGRNNTWTASVSVTDTSGNIVSDIGSGHTVSLSTSGGTLSTTSLTLPATGAATTPSFNLTSQNNNGNYTYTVTATSSGYAPDATATLSR